MLKFLFGSLLKGLVGLVLVALLVGVVIGACAGCDQDTSVSLLGLPLVTVEND